ncbi:MAG: M15 family metallopeptidase [Bacteroidales bacterium]|nr:M15 family metallopeptidase [Bacteroidales bacterium]
MRNGEALNEVKRVNAEFFFLLVASLVLCQQVRAQHTDLVYYQGHFFVSQPIPENVMARMEGKSRPEKAVVAYQDLRYLTLPYYDFNGDIQRGEMVCHKDIASDLLHIFCGLFKAKYPICSIRLVDDFNADDEASMEANNTSCYNHRFVPGTRKLSKHAWGRAIDINPLQNPWIHGQQVHPSTAGAYVDRSKDFAHKIDKNDLCYRLFKEKGFFWGGVWIQKDYQHFFK